MTNNNKIILIRIIGVVISLLWIVLLRNILPVEETASAFSWNGFLIDSSSKNPMDPFSIQAIMWVFFFICLAEVLIKSFHIREERSELKSFDLYSNPNNVTVYANGKDYQIRLDPNEALKPELIAAIYSAKRTKLNNDMLISKMFKKITYQFNATNDVSDVYSVVNADIDLSLHRVDLKYTVLKYLAWLIPTLGFIGTVIGIAVALGQAATMKSDDPEMLKEVIPLLSTAFYTTLLALLMSAIVMILIQVIQALDEKIVSDAGDFCLENIIVNLKPKKD